MPPALFDDPEALLPVMSGYRFAELAARRGKIEDLGGRPGGDASSFDFRVLGPCYGKLRLFTSTSRPVYG